MRTRSLVLLAFSLLPLTAAADPAVYWVDVVADGAVSKGDLERAAGALRAGVRAAGAVVAPDAKSAEKKLVAHLSVAGDEFALRVDSPGEPASAASGPLVLLEDGARRVATRAASPMGKIAVPPDARAEWFVDGKKVALEAGTSLTVAKGTHVVRAQSGSGSALAVVDVAGGETAPFPKAALASLTGAVAAPATVAALSTPKPASTPIEDDTRPRTPIAAKKGFPWLWAGVGGAAVALAGGAALAASQSSGSSSKSPQPSGTPFTDITLHP